MILGLIVVCAIGAVILYYVGGYGSFDPNKAGQDAKAKIAPGMTWKQVMTAAGKPRAYHSIIKQTKGDMEVIRPGPENPFDEAKMADRLAKNELQYGFTFPYVFSRAVAFDVYFDAAGIVDHVENRTTEADLLQMNR
jgi:hypothetical protein